MKAKHLHLCGNCREYFEHEYDSDIEGRCKTRVDQCERCKEEARELVSIDQAESELAFDKEEFYREEMDA